MSGVGRRVKRQIKGATELAADSLCYDARESPVDRTFATVLRATALVAADTVLDYATCGRADDDAVEVVAFRAAITDPSRALAAIRVADWGYVSRVTARNWGPRYDEVIDVAMSSLGVASEWEERIAGFGTFPANRDAWNAAAVRFDRMTLEGVLASAGVELRASEDYPDIRFSDIAELLLWTHAFQAGWPAFDAVVNAG